MRILIIQAPDFGRDFQQLSFRREQVEHFSPAWEVLCLRGTLQSKSRHYTEFVDMRLFTSAEEELERAMHTHDDFRLAVIYADTAAIGFAAGLIELIKRHQQNLPVVLIGPFPTNFPHAHQRLPGLDFAIAGAPEKPLQLLADNLDLPPRWKHIPGLSFSGHTASSPHLRPAYDKALDPELQGVFWAAYKQGPQGLCRAGFRITEGHSGLACDRAFPVYASPLRILPLERMASIVERCSHMEIDVVRLKDPPGAWTRDLLEQWCDALLHVRNLQPWTFRILPAWLDDALLERLRMSGCRRIEFLFPASSPEGLTAYECSTSISALRSGLESMRQAGIRSLAHFWLQGPESGPHEEKSVLRWLRELPFDTYSLSPYPLSIDAPVYQEKIPESERSHLEKSIRWARAPWMEERLLPLWCGPQELPELERVREQIVQTMEKGIGNRLRRLRQEMRPAHLTHRLEEVASEWITTIFPTHRTLL